MPQRILPIKVTNTVWLNSELLKDPNPLLVRLKIDHKEGDAVECVYAVAKAGEEFILKKGTGADNTRVISSRPSEFIPLNLDAWNRTPGSKVMTCDPSLDACNFNGGDESLRPRTRHTPPTPPKCEDSDLQCFHEAMNRQILERRNKEALERLSQCILNPQPGC